MSERQGAPFGRRYGQELVSKPAILLKKSWGGYRRTTRLFLLAGLFYAVNCLEIEWGRVSGVLTGEKKAEWHTSRPRLYDREEGPGFSMELRTLCSEALSRAQKRTTQTYTSRRRE